MLISSPRGQFDIVELLAAASYSVGHQPDDGLVVVLLTSQNRVRTFQDFTLDTNPVALRADLLQLANVYDADRVVVIGYGPDSARPSVTAVIRLLLTNLHVEAAVLVTGAHYVCLCGGQDCPHRQPTPFDLSSTAITAAMTPRGAPVPPSAALIRGPQEPDPDRRVRARTAELVAALRPTARPQLGLLVRVMREARAGLPLSDVDAARLAVALLDPSLQKRAWMATRDELWHRNLWVEMVRRVDQAHLAAPASLLAWAAWQRGERLLATLAARRASDLAPDNDLSVMITRLLRWRQIAEDVIWASLPIPPGPRPGTPRG
ncbi:DUF4192 domain-containing protein [Actinoplanes sp. NPDC000266]